MDYAVEEIEPDHWRVRVAGTVRLIRYRRDIRTFAPWDICTEDGRRLWGSPTLESAFRWIQARTGQSTEGMLVEGLLEWSSTGPASDPAHVTSCEPEAVPPAHVLEWGR
ncbi:MAG: hypothetical protein JSR36_00560 [Proteobacteria bacterium]|nr:hypothetical protein [Pseudomonadota bacterium]